jgi:hypothetical protein
VWGACATSTVAAWTELRATVRLGSGVIHWQNIGSEELEITGYTLSSSSGSLRPGQWQPITDRLDDGGDGSFDADGSWVILSPLQPFPPTASDLSEGVFVGNGGSLAPGELIALGAAWNPSGSTDIQLQISTPVPTIVPINVHYLPAGDFNLDGIVDATDYTVWRNSVGQTGLGLLADANGDGVVNGTDYTLWKADFGDTEFLAPAALQFARGSVVPEPGTMAVALGMTFAGLLVTAVRRARRSATSLE